MSSNPKAIPYSLTHHKNVSKIIIRPIATKSAAENSENPLSLDPILKSKLAPPAGCTVTV